jgi:ABC-type xylose transport system permease subunit
LTSAGRNNRFVLYAASAFAGLLIASGTALAQCAMCKNAVTGSPDAARLAGSLNLAIIILLIPPVLIFCGIFYALFRRRKSRETVGGSAGAGRRTWREKLSFRRKSGKQNETGGALA